jgi:hypothetical protein
MQSNVQVNINTPSGLPSGGNVQIGFDINKFFDYYSNNQQVISNNYSPVAIKDIGLAQQSNIRITGSFLTNFDPEIVGGYDGMAYITVRRRSTGIAKACEGYGIALRPTEAGAIQTTISAGGVTDNLDGTYNIIITSATGFLSGGGIGYIITEHGAVAFRYDSIGGVGTTLMGCVFPDNIIPVAGNLINNAYNNLFVVDNDLVGADIYNHHQIEHDTGVMSYLKSGLCEIKKDTRYYYQLVINSDNSLSFKISETEDGLGVAGCDGIDNGAYTPLSEYLGTANMTAFGISVINTRGYSWQWGAIRIASITGEYPIAYFEMDTNLIAESFRAFIKGRGVGYNSGAIAYGLELYAYNNNNTVWDRIGVNSYESIESGNSTIVTEAMTKTEYTNADGFALFYCKPVYPSGSLVDQDAELDIDLFKLESAMNTSVHIGSCTDIYVDDSEISPASLDVNVTDHNHVPLAGIDGRAIAFIDKVALVVEEVEYELVEYIDYTIHYNDDRLKGSTAAELYLKMAPSSLGNVRVYYYYSPLVKAVQSDVERLYNNIVSQDILVKHMDIYMLDADSDVSGINTNLYNYIMTLLPDSDKRITLSWNKFIGYLRTESIYPASLTINIEHNTGAGTKEIVRLAANGDEYTISRFATFKVKEVIESA